MISFPWEEERKDNGTQKRISIDSTAQGSIICSHLFSLGKKDEYWFKT